MNLTETQITAWKQLGSQLSAPPNLCQMARVFYLSYRQTEFWSFDKYYLIMKVAFFLSEKSQIVCDQRGKKIKGIALSANAILRDHPRHEQFLHHLKQMLRTIQLPPNAKHLQQQVTIFSRHLSFCINFLNKFRTILKKIKISQKLDDNSEQHEMSLKLLWLLFIDSKMEMRIGLEIIQSTCLMSNILTFYIAQKYKQEGVFSIYFEHEQGCTLGNEIEDLRQFFRNYFHIKDCLIFEKINLSFNSYMHNVGKYLEMKKPFSNHHIQKNIYVVQKLYSKKISDNTLDQSTFLRSGSNVSNLPFKMTPFGRKAVLEPRNTPALSHRILTYEMNEELQQNKIGMQNRSKEETQGFSMLNKLKFNPTPKSMLIRSTPMSEAMQMYNWLYQKSIKYECRKEDNKLFIEILSFCRKQQCDNIQINNNQCLLLNGIWQDSLKFSEGQGLNKNALLFLCASITWFILNCPERNIEESIQQMNLSEYQIWKGLDFLINYDKTTPTVLKLHLLCQQTTFINSRLWSNAKNAKKINNESECFQNRLFRRVIHQSIFQIHFICKKMNIEEVIQDSSFLILQQSLKHQNLLFNHCLEHLVMCSIYAGAKVRESNIKFNDILVVCKEVLGLSAANYQELINSVAVNSKRENIIVFYNQMFRIILKPFLLLLKTRPIQEIKNQNMLDSGVKTLIAKEASNMSTPQMATYLAYNQSPILGNRHRLKEIAINTIRKQQQYSLQDIEAKFGKNMTNQKMKQTRKIKH